MSKGGNSNPKTQIIVAVIAAGAVIISAILSYKAAREPVLLVIGATQTAEAKPTFVAQTLTAQAYQKTLTATIPTASPTQAVETSTPKPTPTIKINTDPNIYDDFDNPATKNTFDESLWEYWGDNSQIGFSQEDGALKFSGTTSTALVARRHINLYLRAPTFYETNLMLASGRGSVTMKMHGDLSANNYWTTQCGLYGPLSDGKTWAFCDYGTKEDSNVTYTDGKNSGLYVWHNFRIEINPSQQTVTYYIDGESIGNFIVPEIESAKFSLVIGTDVSSGTVTALVEDIKYGLLE